MDPFEENIQNLFHTADTEGKGYISREDFITVSITETQAINLLTHSLIH